MKGASSPGRREGHPSRSYADGHWKMVLGTAEGLGPAGTQSCGVREVLAARHCADPDERCREGAERRGGRADRERWPAPPRSWRWALRPAGLALVWSLSSVQGIMGFVPVTVVGLVSH